MPRYSIRTLDGLTLVLACCLVLRIWHNFEGLTMDLTCRLVLRIWHKGFGGLTLGLACHLGFGFKVLRSALLEHKDFRGAYIGPLVLPSFGN